MSPAAANLASASFPHDTCADELAALQEDLAARRQRGEHLLSPLSFRQLEAMAQRLPDQSTPVRRILLSRLDQTLARHDGLVKQAQDQAKQLLAVVIAQQPEQIREARGLLATGDLSALKHLSRQHTHAPASPLAELNRRMEQLAQADADPSMGSDIIGPADMKSLRQFKDTWARIAAEDDVKQAIERGPRNAGPLNSHQLVLKSLSLMREVSPDYLRRFMTHLDALLWLDQRIQKPTATDGKPARPSRAKPAIPKS